MARVLSGVGGFVMRPIDQILFARLMLLPEAQRTDLLEYAGATALGDDQLESVVNQFIANLCKKPVAVDKLPN
jgi:hypothetical protein